MNNFERSARRTTIANLSVIATTSLAVIAGCALPARTTARVEDGATVPDVPTDRMTPMDVRDDAPDAGDGGAPTDVADASDADVGADVPDATGAARITGRVRFLETGTVVVSFNGVARTFTAAAGAPIDFDVSTPLPATAHTINVTGGTSTQTCTVILPSPAPMRETMVAGVEVRCVIAAQHQLTAPDERLIELPASTTPMPRPLTEVPEFVVNQPAATSVLLSLSVSNLSFTSTTTLGAVEVAFVDATTGQVAGRAVVRRPNGNTRTAALSTVAIMQLAAGMHRIRPAFWHYDVTGPVAGNAQISYGVRPERGITVASDGPLTVNYNAVLLDSLSTFDRATLSEWAPSASEPTLAMGQDRVIPLAPAVRPMIPAGGGALYALTPPSASGPVQWDLLSDGATLARGAAFYDDAELPHAMLAAQPTSAALSPMITARLTRYGYRNSFGPADASVRLDGALATHFSGMPRSRTPQTPARLGTAVFGAGVRMYASRNSEPMWGTTMAPAYSDPRNLEPIRVRLTAPRRVLFFARLATARVLSDGPVGDVRLVRRTGAMVVPLAQVMVQSSNAQNSQGLYLSAIADLPVGDHELQVSARPVTSVGAIPPGGITTGYAVSYTPDLLDLAQPVGHIATGALVLE